MFLDFWSLCLMAFVEHLAVINPLCVLLNKNAILHIIKKKKTKQTCSALVKSLYTTHSWLRKLSVYDKKINADEVSRKFLWNAYAEDFELDHWRKNLHTVKMHLRKTHQLTIPMFKIFCLKYPNLLIEKSFKCLNKANKASILYCILLCTYSKSNIYYQIVV